MTSSLDHHAAQLYTILGQGRTRDPD